MFIRCYRDIDNSGDIGVLINADRIQRVEPLRGEEYGFCVLLCSRVVYTPDKVERAHGAYTIVLKSIDELEKLLNER